MGRLFLVEISRIWFRRLVRVLAILAMAGALLAGIIVFFQSNGDDEGIRSALEQRDREVTECINNAPDGVEPPPEFESFEDFCSQNVVPVEAYDPRFRLVEFEDILLGTSVMIVILGWVLGSTAVGAEWHYRSMTTLLTWEPRRTRVLIAKLVATTLMAFLISMFLQLWLLAMLTPAAAFRGSTEGVDADWFIDVLALMARVGLVASLGAAMGAALAFIGRNTAAALGAGFAYLAIVEGLIRGLKPEWQRWLIGDNAATVIGGSDEIIIGRSIGGAVVMISIYALLLALAAGAFFKSRDVP